MVAAAIVGGGAISGITGLVGASESASAQQQAAAAQAAATQAAIAAEQQQFQTGLGYTAPYANYGTGSEAELLSEMGLASVYGGTSTPGDFSGSGGYLGAEPNISDPSQLPGYNFTLTQGENAVNNASSATGTAAVPGSGNFSGPQSKGLINYAEGLASSYYSTFLQNYWANQNNRYNMLGGLINQGLGAATSIQGNAVTAGGQIGTTGVSGTAAANNYNVGAANTQAAGLTGLGSNISSNLLLASALGNTGTTLGGGGNSANIDVGGPGSGNVG